MDQDHAGQEDKDQDIAWVVVILFSKWIGTVIDLNLIPLLLRFVYGC